MTRFVTVVIAKEPRPGRVKTRLTPPLSQEQAAALAEAALVDTLAAAVGAGGERTVLALDGAPGRWLPPGVDVVPQRGDGLDQRLAAAFEDAFALVEGPLVLVGMDTPQVTADHIRAAAQDLSTHHSVLGPAEDGGFWLLGLRRPERGLLEGVPMSTGGTGAAQLARLRAAGHRTAILPTLRDVDVARDARAVADLAPATRFARAVASVADLLGGARV